MCFLGIVSQAGPRKWPNRGRCPCQASSSMSYCAGTSGTGVVGTALGVGRTFSRHTGRLYAQVSLSRANLLGSHHYRQILRCLFEHGAHSNFTVTKLSRSRPNVHVVVQYKAGGVCWLIVQPGDRPSPPITNSFDSNPRLT